MSAGVIGGFLLIIGAFFTYRGEIFKAVGIYFVADICWVYISYSVNDYFGMIATSIGMIFGLLAFIKMNKGKLRKTLKW